MPASRPTPTPGVVLLCAVQFVDVLGVTSATTAIPAIASDLSADPGAVTALATAYAALFGAFLVVGARLGDRYGHRRVLLVGLVLFAAVAGVGAVAVDVVAVVAARALQGLSAAISIPCALRLLLHLTPDDRARTAAIALWSGAGAAAGAAGFLVGGALVESWSWRSIFWLNVPVGLLLAALVRLRVGRAPVPSRAGRLDLPGAPLLVAAVIALVTGAALIEDPGSRVAGAGVLVGGAVLGGAFASRQRRAEHPLLPADVLRRRSLRTGVALSLVNTATTSSTGVLLTLHLQQHLGDSPLRAGLQLLPLSLAVVVGSAWAGRLARGRRLPGVAGRGLALVAAGNLTLAAAAGHRPGIAVGVSLTGLGLGLASVAATRIGTSVPDALSASAGGIVNTAAQLGTALGVAGFLSLAAVAAPGPVGSTVAWAGIAALAAATAVATVRRSGEERGRAGRRRAS